MAQVPEEGMDGRVAVAEFVTQTANKPDNSLAL
jgi:hypothetical protein